MQLTVELSERSYPIYIGQHILDASRFEPFVNARNVLIVTNPTIAPFYHSTLLSALTSAKQVDTVMLEDGEQFKSMVSIERIWTKALEEKLNRSSVMIALGGGVLGDMTGFAAACYQRGIDFIQVPTTLLSQVDSSVGGKTGINHPLGKNMIGAFHQPKAVVIDTLTLDTLSGREVAAGLAEVIKYGLIEDVDFFVWIESNIDALVQKDHKALSYAIRRSCEIKANIVKQDETEQSGVRALLNLGHTFGHAIETLCGYGHYLHGEAIAIGTLMAITLSNSVNKLDIQILERTVSLYRKAGLPVTVKGIDSLDAFLAVMSVDKKNVNGSIRLILLRELGKAYLTEEYDEKEMHNVIRGFLDK